MMGSGKNTLLPNKNFFLKVILKDSAANIGGMEGRGTSDQTLDGHILGFRALVGVLYLLTRQSSAMV